jgi:hypothetical protein
VAIAALRRVVDALEAKVHERKSDRQAEVAGIGAFISPGRSLSGGIERARLADRLGFDAIYTMSCQLRWCLNGARLSLPVW